MGRKLVAVGVIGAWTGPWHSAQGCESSALAGPLASGEQVRLEVERNGHQSIHYDLSSGPVHFALDQAKDWLRYRAVKLCAGAAAPVPTTVEVILGGSLGNARS